MASIQTSKSGRRRCLFIDRAGQRRQIALGVCAATWADQAAIHVEMIARSQEAGAALDKFTREWLMMLPAKIHARLVGVGLIDAPSAPATVSNLILEWVGKRAHELSPSTSMRLANSQRQLVDFLGSKLIKDVTEADAQDYRSHLLARGLAEATVRKRCADARQWFGYALKKRIIESNPFLAVAAAPVATERTAYISEEDANRVLDRISDPDLGLVFVLARWGGLRIPSEAYALTWADLAPISRTLLVRSSKTGSRKIPLFLEIEAALHDRGQTDGPIIANQKPACTLRAPLLAAIKAAGLQPWPRLWHNLRASRQTDLEREYPTHVVCAWMGNSSGVAHKHYLRPTEQDWARAVGGLATVAKEDPNAA